MVIIGTHFEIGELLGEGGMGSVYRGLDTHTGQAVAIKRLRGELVSTPDSLVRFANEAEALRRLNHPMTDFGIARIETDRRVTETGVTIGTLDYLSPEALNGESADGRTDIWAFGVMLVGERPFQGNSSSQILTAILTQSTPDLEAQRLNVK